MNIEQLQQRMRFGDHRATINLALQLDDPDIARRAAWLAIESGDPWTCEVEGQERPLIRDPNVSALYREIEESRSIVIGNARIQALWDHQRARLFACDCAESVLHLFNRSYSGVDVLRAALNVTRSFALKNASSEDLQRAHDECAAVAHERWVAPVECKSVSYQVSTCFIYAARPGAYEASTRCSFSSARAFATSLVVRWNPGLGVERRAWRSAWQRHTRDVTTPLLLKWMLLPVDELTSASS